MFWCSVKPVAVVEKLENWPGAMVGILAISAAKIEKI